MQLADVVRFRIMAMNDQVIVNPPASFTVDLLCGNVMFFQLSTLCIMLKELKNIDILHSQIEIMESQQLKLNSITWNMNCYAPSR